MLTAHALGMTLVLTEHVVEVEVEVDVEVEVGVVGVGLLTDHVV